MNINRTFINEKNDSDSIDTIYDDSDKIIHSPEFCLVKMKLLMIFVAGGLILLILHMNISLLMREAQRKCMLNTLTLTKKS
jgi:hypothetical protein